MLLLVDGTNALMRRATVIKDADPAAVAEDVLARIRRATGTIGATHLIVCFDSKDSHRARLFPGYKLSRTLDTQRYVRAGHKIFTGAGLVCRGSSGWEADDVIATLAVKSKAKVATLSSDNDILALASERVTCWQYAPKSSLGTWLISYNVQEVIAKFGVHPKQLLDFQALVGKNDVPGVPGIGKVKAGALLTRFGSITNMIEHQARTGESILGPHTDTAVFARDLLTFNTNVPLELPTGSACKSDFSSETK